MGVTGLIRDRLHWLPVAQRIQFKLCLMMYKAMHGLAPAYLSELCASSCVEGRTRLSARGDLAVQRTRTKFGGRAFRPITCLNALEIAAACSYCSKIDSTLAAVKYVNWSRRSYYIWQNLMTTFDDCRI